MSPVLQGILYCLSHREAGFLAVLVSISVEIRWCFVNCGYPFWMEHVMWKSLSHVWLFAIPWTIQSMEISMPEYWSGLPFLSPGHLPNPGIESRSPTLQADSLPDEPLDGTWVLHFATTTYPRPQPHCIGLLWGSDSVSLLSDSQRLCCCRKEFSNLSVKGVNLWVSRC